MLPARGKGVRRLPALLRRLLREERCQSEWNSVYLLIVFIIAAILIIALVKPMFKQSQDIIKDQPVLQDKK